MNATPAIDMRENRVATRRQDAGSFTRPSTITKPGMPPTQIAAPSWCSASTASSGRRYSIRAAA